jgi:hypothetical protein
MRKSDKKVALMKMEMKNNTINRKELTTKHLD